MRKGRKQHTYRRQLTTFITLNIIMDGTNLTHCITLSPSMCGTELTHCITFHIVVGGREMTTFQHIELNRVYIALGCAELTNFITLHSAQRLVVVVF